MALSASQATAFETSTGVNAATLTLVVASIAALVFLLWGVWLAYAQLKLWAKGDSDLFDLSVNLTRTAVIMLLLGFLIR